MKQGTADAIASGMKHAPLSILYHLPLPELRKRAERARDLLRNAGAHSAGSPKSIDRALHAIDELMPWIAERPRTLLIRTIADLAPHERAVLRQAIDAERAARARREQMLGEVSVAQAEDALERIELKEQVFAELSAFLRVVENTYGATPLLSA
jgi:hypothetical protein